MVRRQLDVQIGSPRGGRAVIDREGENCIEQAGGSPGMSQDREETGALGIPPFSDYREGRVAPHKLLRHRSQRFPTFPSLMSRLH